MLRTKRRAVKLAITLATIGAGWLTLGTASPRGAQSAAKTDGEWSHYGRDAASTRYSPLAQIDASNFDRLEIAWRLKTDNLGPRPEFKLEGTPLMMNGVVYATAGSSRSVVALDARTGQLLWVHSMPEGKRAAVSPRVLSGRGLSYWSDGRGDERVLYMTIGYRLVALSAKTGAMIPTFGKNGVVDLKEGMVVGGNQPLELETNEVGIHATPLVARDTVVVGVAFQGGMKPTTHNKPKGLARAYDVRTGKLLWTFNNIPQPGQFGSDTWEKDSWATNGNTGTWAQISADEELGLVYLPVEDPTGDLYGGHRPGDNLFGDSLVCLDLRTGERKWHFQLVHHPIWDMDIPAAPVLADITVNGRAVKAVAQPTKQGFLYVFDRVTGQPVWPIEERPVPQSDVPGEKTAATQPHPTKPPPYGRNNFRIPDDVIDFTPELRAEGLEVLKRYKYGPLFNPPILGDVKGLMGALSLGTGVANWPGAAYDPETHNVYIAASNATMQSLSVAAPPPEFSDMRYVQGVAGQAFTPAAVDSFGRINVQGLPVLKPPYGVMTAIALDRGEILWQVPRGDTPDIVRNHPALKGLSIPKTGEMGWSGTLVTKTLVISGDAQVTTIPSRGRGAMLRAYNKDTGAQVGAILLPAPQSGSPMTYSVDGRQYIVVAVSGGSYSGEYIAFRLPTS